MTFTFTLIFTTFLQFTNLKVCFFSTFLKLLFLKLTLRRCCGCFVNHGECFCDNCSIFQSSYVTFYDRHTFHLYYKYTFSYFFLKRHSRNKFLNAGKNPAAEGHIWGSG